MSYSLTVAPSTLASADSAIAHTVHSLTSATRWRDVAQLRGLQANHPALPLYGAPLAPPSSTVFSASRLALHSSEDALAVGLTLLGDARDGGSAGLLPLTTLHAGGSSEVELADLSRLADLTTTMRWLDFPLTDSASQYLTSLEWADELLLLGCTGGMVFVGDYGAAATRDPSGVFASVGTLSVSASGEPSVVGSDRYSPSGLAPSTAVRSLRSGAIYGSSNRLLGAFDGELVLWDLNGGATPLWSRSATTTTMTGKDPATVVRWSPHCGGAATVAASGTIGGILMLHDTRQPASASSIAIDNSAATISGVEFHPSLPWLMASGTSTGSLNVYDLRFPGSSAVMNIPTCQGGVTAMRWVTTQPDLLVSSGRDATTRLWCLRSSPSFCVGTWRHRLPLMDLVTTRTFAQTQCIGVGIDGELVCMNMPDAALSSFAPSHIVVSDGSSDAAAPSTPQRHHRVLRDEAVQRGLAALYCRNMREATGVLLDVIQRAVSAQDHATATILLEHLTPCPVHPFRLDNFVHVWKDLLGVSDAAPEEKSKPRAGLGLQPTADPVASVQSNGTGAQMTFSAAKLRSILDADIDLYARRIPESICVWKKNQPASTTLAAAPLRGVAHPSPAQQTRLESLRLNVSIQRCCTEEDVAGVMRLLRAQAEAVRKMPSAVEYLNAETLCSAAVWLVNKQRTSTDAPLDVIADVLDALILPDGSSPSKPLVRKLVLAVLSPLVIESKHKPGQHDKDEVGTAVEKRRLRAVDRCMKDLKSFRDATMQQLRVISMASAGGGGIVQMVSAYQEQCAAAASTSSSSSTTTSIGIFSWLSERAIMAYLEELSQSSVAGLAVFLWTSVQCLHHLAGLSSGTASKIEALFFDVLHRLEKSQQKLKGQLKTFLGILDPTTLHGDEDDDHDPPPPPVASHASPRDAAKRKRSALLGLHTLLPGVHAYCHGVLSVQLQCEAIAESSGVDEDDLPLLMRTATELLNTCSSDLLEVWADVLDAVRAEREAMPEQGDAGRSTAAKRQRRSEQVGPTTAPEDVMRSLMDLVEQFADDCNNLLDDSPDDEMLHNVLEICDDFLEDV